MSTVPDSIVQKIAFYNDHLDPWQTNAAAIGLTVPQMTDLNAKVTAAQTALQQAEQAKLAARAATENLRIAMTGLDGLGAAAVRAIRFKAVSSGDNNVYVLAQIPAPKPRSPKAAPGTPSAVGVSLIPGGALKLKWRCKNPPDASGTMYEVRRAAANSAMELIGTTGQKTFTDQTLAPGTPSVTYHLTAVRSTRGGEPAQFSVQFGAGDSGPGAAQPTLTMIRKAA